MTHENHRPYWRLFRPVLLAVLFVFGMMWVIAPSVMQADASALPTLTPPPVAFPVLPGDAYEPDDTCAGATVIATDGVPQTHDFHRNGDEDWVKFQVVSGTAYALQTANPQYSANTQLALLSNCDQPALQVDNNPFGLDARMVWWATYSGTAYLKTGNVPPTLFGAGTGYDLAVRASRPMPVVVIVAGSRSLSDTQQAKIDAAADMAYRMLLSAGVLKDNLHYLGPNPQRDVDGNQQIDDIADQTSLESVSDAIQVWTHTRNLTSSVPLYIYLVGPSMPDALFVGGSEISQTLTSGILSGWLAELEHTTGVVSISVVIDACFAGSFITATINNTDTLSAPGRVIVASTPDTGNAYASAEGMRFSEIFWTALGQSQDIKTAVDLAQRALMAVGLAQTPWLDDNANRQIDSLDGAVAHGRGLMTTHISRPPVIDFVSSSVIRAAQSDLTVQVRDDYAVARVRVEIYPPGFIEPAAVISESVPTLSVLTQMLARRPGSDLFGTQLANLIAPGCYRVVVFAQDFEQNVAMPQAALICVPWRVWLPSLPTQ